MLGTKPGADALNLVRRRLAAGEHRAFGGLNRNRLERGLARLDVLGHAGQVPPVPMPEIRMSTLPSVSFQISGPVVSKWILGLAGLSNCCSM